MILNLAFALLTVDRKPIQAVNAASDKTLALQHSMYELRNVIPQIIHRLAQAQTQAYRSCFPRSTSKTDTGA